MNKRMLVVIATFVLGVSLLAIIPASANVAMDHFLHLPLVQSRSTTTMIFSFNNECCPPPPPLDPPPGTGTPGYWKNHPEDWYRFYDDQYLDELNLYCTAYDECGCTDYCSIDKDQLITWMDNPVSGNKTYTMLKAVVAAKLNRLAGNPSYCIDQTLLKASLWLKTYGFEGCGNITVCEASDECWEEGEPLYEMLDAYNNGELCAPERD